MKTYFYLLFVSIIILPALSNAEEFLGVPVISQMDEVSRTDTRLEVETPMSHDEVVAFYKKALQKLPDVKVREWKKSTYIEDDGANPWHSITISKGNAGEKVSVVIMKDNWTWIIGTLILRYIGVFVVLLILLLGMSLSGAIVSRYVAREKSKQAAS